MNELDILRDVASRLDRAGIHYMLTGSLALIYYAEPRLTRDIDLIVELQTGDADLVIGIFENDYYVPEGAVRRALKERSLFNLIHKQEVVKVDFVIKKDTEYRRIEFERRTRVQIDGAEIWIVSKEDLIVSKLYWAKDSHSEFQLRDVKNLLKTGYDASYLQRWTEHLGLMDLLKECIDE
jgi:predicted nucleotidyltransferase